MDRKQRRSALRPLVLIVDDHEESSEVCAMFLQLEGFDTIVAGSAAQALQRLVNDSPDAVVTDIAMPGMDGWTVVHATRHSATTRDVPVVVVSGHVDSATRNRAAQEGCTFLAKPCDPSQLADLLHTQLRDTSRTALS